MIKSSSNHWGIQFYGQCGIIVGGMHVPVPGVEQHIHLSLLETCTGLKLPKSQPKINVMGTLVPGLAWPYQNNPKWLINGWSLQIFIPASPQMAAQTRDPNGPDSGAADACRWIDHPGQKKLGNLVWHQHVDLCYVLWWIRWRYLIYVRLW